MPRAVAVEIPQHEQCKEGRVSWTLLRVPYQSHVLSGVLLRRASSHVPTQRTGLPSTQDNKHAQSVHDATTSSSIPPGFVAATRTYLTPARA